MAVTTGKIWSQFLEEAGVVTEITAKDYLVGYRSPTDDIIAGTGENIGIPINLINLYKKVTVTAAQLKACGTTAISLLTAPGAGLFHSVSKIVVTRASGGAAYAFGDYLSFGSNGGDVQFVIDNALFNVTGQLNLDLVKQGQSQIANAAYILSLIGGATSDSLTGDKDIDIEIYYTINQVKA